MPNYMKTAGMKYQKGGSTIKQDGKIGKQTIGTIVKPKKQDGGSLKDVPTNKQKSLGQLPADVRNKMGYKKGGGSLLYKMTGGPMMDMSEPMVMNMRGRGGGMQSRPAKAPKAGKGKIIY